MEDSCLPPCSPWSLLRKLQQTDQTQHGLSASQPGGRLSLTVDGVDRGEAFLPLLHEPCGGTSYTPGAVAGVFISLKFVSFS